jgi:hypothetical protein
MATIQESVVEDHAPEARPPEGREQLAWVDLSPLSSGQVLDLHRYARDSDEELASRINNVLDYIVELNSPRAKELFNAYLDSPIPEDREEMQYRTKCLYGLTKVDHDSGVLLLNHLLRDRIPAIRQDAHRDFMREIEETSTHRAAKDSDPDLYVIELVDELLLHEHTGLTKEDATSLVNAYAEAEQHGKVYDPGLEALGELRVAHRY